MAFMYVLELLRNFFGGALAFIHLNSLVPGTYILVTKNIIVKKTRSLSMGLLSMVKHETHMQNNLKFVNCIRLGHEKLTIFSHL